MCVCFARRCCCCFQVLSIQVWLCSTCHSSSFLFHSSDSLTKRSWSNCSLASPRSPWRTGGSTHASPALPRARRSSSGSGRSWRASRRQVGVDLWVWVCGCGCVWCGYLVCAVSVSECINVCINVNLYAVVDLCVCSVSFFDFLFLHAAYHHAHPTFFLTCMDLQAQRAAVLQFATGTSRVPIGGFRNLSGAQSRQPFTVSKVDMDPGQPMKLPMASTWWV